MKSMIPLLIAMLPLASAAQSQSAPPPGGAQPKTTGVMVLLTARQVGERGAPTFGALVVTSKFAEANADFVSRYVNLIDGYYVSFNMFNAAGTAFLGAQVCALDRIRMITAATHPECASSSVRIPTSTSCRARP